MNYIKQNHLSLLVVLWLALGSLFGAKAPVPQPVDLGVALNSLSTFTNPIYFKQGHTSGGTVFATTSSGVVTLTNTDLTENNTVLYTPIIVGGTITLPTKANLTGLSTPFIPNAGDHITKYIINATTSALAQVSIAGNTGVIIQNASSTSNTVAGFSGPGVARLDFYRNSTTTDIYVLVNFYK